MKEINDEIEINGIKYIQKDKVAVQQKASTLLGKKYVIVRTYSAGVFAGYLEKRNGQEATIIQARRLWYWKGAASLSQLAVDGVSKPDECKFPCEVSQIELTQVIEVLDCTEKARLSIAGVKIWQM